ncbi:MAG: hypothetical protein AOA65_2379 [Candidatus Bathyarchaeota archaeon BA1]|nr:MAG: hypothetical protein AOA65_2379 [Candidatus Bathyarchaeota archaeon BA1]
MLVYDRSLDDYISEAVRRYSSLFTLPSYGKIILLLFISCLLGGVLAVLPVHPSYYGVASGMDLGASVLFITLLSDFIIHYSGMRRDPVLNRRRRLALSIFSNLVWFCFIFIGGVIGVFLKNPEIWAKGFLLGFCAALLLRLLVVLATSFVDRGRAFLFAFLQPASCIIPLFLMETVIGYRLGANAFIFLSVSTPVAMLTVFIFIYLVDRIGTKTLGIASLPLFKAFVANWTENLNEPLESLFEGLGDEQSIKISMLAFRANKKMKALLVVPMFHPGPFKNVGSSTLPQMIQEALENKLQCVVSVPHGLSGHGLDLPSQLQNGKVMEGILKSVNFSTFASDATPFTRVQNNASSSCQIFGDCALLTLTVAPKTMEDLPQELDLTIVNEAEKRGLSTAIVIDAHNSIEGPFNLSEAVKGLRKAAVNSLEEAMVCQRSSFDIGAAKVIPKEFSVKEGIAPGGISVIAIKVGDRKAAYITIDGNNMISKLRERVLSMLQEISVVDGEVLTTDTHVVNGIVLTARGYYPIGEALDQNKLIGYIKEATLNALGNMETAEASWCIETISGVKVIGEKQIGTLCLLAERAAKQAKRIAISLFSIIGILLISLLMLL